jgi:hypothetical protein
MQSNQLMMTLYTVKNERNHTEKALKLSSYGFQPTVILALEISSDVNFSYKKLYLFQKKNPAMDTNVDFVEKLQTTVEI